MIRCNDHLFRTLDPDYYQDQTRPTTWPVYSWCKCPKCDIHSLGGPHITREEPMSILDEAAERVDGSANLEYGEAKTHLDSVARVWTEQLRSKLTCEIEPHEVAYMMAGFKLVRLAHKYKRDSLVDCAGYLRCAEIVTDAA